MIKLENVYACLAGNWVNLCEDETCVMGPNMQKPYLWWKEGGDIFSPITKNEKNTYYHLDYILIHYKGKDYRINPIFIQIVTE